MHRFLEIRIVSHELNMNFESPLTTPPNCQMWSWTLSKQPSQRNRAPHQAIFSGDLDTGWISIHSVGECSCPMVCGWLVRTESNTWNSSLIKHMKKSKITTRDFITNSPCLPKPLPISVDSSRFYSTSLCSNEFERRQLKENSRRAGGGTTICGSGEQEVSGVYIGCLWTRTLPFPVHFLSESTCLEFIKWIPKCETNAWCWLVDFLTV